MAIIVRKTYVDPDCATQVNMLFQHRQMTIGPVYPSANIDSAVPVRVAFNAVRNRYECVAAGGVGLAANTSLQALIHGFTYQKTTFQVGPNAEPVQLMIEAEYGVFSDDVTTAMYPVFLSAVTAGAYDTVAPYPGAIPFGYRFGYKAKAGDRVYVNVHGARFGQY